MDRATKRQLRFRNTSQSCLFGDAFGQEAITDPGLGLDILPRTFGFEFAAKLADEDAQILRLVRRLASPYRRQQGAMGKGLARIACHVEQQIELGRSEVQA